MTETAATAPKDAPSVVLDTNTVFDWLVFDEPAVAPLVAAITAGTIRWLATSQMRNECEHTLARGFLIDWQPDPVAIARAWDAHAVMQPSAPPGPLRCTDPDDQMFIDFALAQRAAWLLTRDRALLKLRRRAALHGLRILDPRDWTPAAP